MLAIRLTDEVWDSPHTISLLNDFWSKNKAADCLSRLVKPTLTSASVNMLTASPADGPAFNTRSHTQNTSPSATSTPQADISPQVSQESTTTPKPLTVD